MAFAGHNRSRDLGDADRLRQELAGLFAGLAEAGFPRARLLTGLAAGADRLAVEAWRAAGLGPVHGVLPFLTQDREAAALADAVTRLDGQAAEREGRNPHLAQTRFLVAQADLLVVVWGGGPARGSGGTADAVRLALAAGIPVLWAHAASEPLQLVEPDRLPPGLDFAELVEALPGAVPGLIAAPTTDDLRRALRGAHASPESDDRNPAATGLDRWLHRWLWRSYAVFQRLLGGRPLARPALAPPPEDLQAQEGFRVLSAAYETADGWANRLAAVHRSEQVLLLAGAVTAAVVGSLPVLFHSLKPTAVMIELALGLVALVVWWTAGRSRRHHRWTEARRRAEALRMARVAWALGFRAPACPRSGAAPPQGAYDADRTAAWGRWGLDEAVVGQAHYHSALSARSHHIARRLERLEDGSFIVLLLVLSGYAAAAVLQAPAGFHMPRWADDVVLISSIIVPAVSAAAMALEAKLEFEEQAERSRALALRLSELQREAGDAPSLARLQALLLRAMSWLAAEADQWREGAVRRRLVRGG